MKIWKSVLTCITLFLMLLLLTGCGTPVKPADDSEPATSSETELSGIGRVEHMDITEPMLKGEYIGKSSDSAGLPSENIFISDETMLGVDYVSFADVEGSVMCYLKDGKITSMNFGSTAFENQTAFYEAMIRLNKKTAAELETQETELKFIGKTAGGVGELEQVFQGTGIFSAEYSFNGCKIVLNGLGVNSEATIVVEVQPAGGGE